MRKTPRRRAVSFIPPFSPPKVATPHTRGALHARTLDRTLHAPHAYRMMPAADLQPPSAARADEPRERAQRLLTRRSLIAFDLDKTVLHQGHHSELQTFTMSVCQTLIHLAVQRYNISAVTGNDLHQLSSRFMKTLVEELCRHQQLQLLSVMHLFCNCATVYICFSLDSPVLAALLAKQATLAPQQLQEAALEALFHTVDGLLEIRPDFIVPEYLARTCMPSAEARKIAELAQAAADEWWAGMCTADGRALRPEWVRDYYINGTAAEANAALEAEALSSDGNPEASVAPRPLARPAACRAPLATHPSIRSPANAPPARHLPTARPRAERAPRHRRRCTSRTARTGAASSRCEVRWCTRAT